MIVNDGRNFLKLTRSRFDVITVDPPPPIDAAGVNHLYSREFLELTRSRLNQGGITAHWIPLPGTKSGVDDWPTFNMLVATFASDYPHTAAIESWHKIGYHLLGTIEEPIRIQDELLQKRLALEFVAKDLEEWDRVPAAYFRKLVHLPSARPRARLITDDRPHLEFNLLRYWRSGTQKLHPIVY
jgi:predicted membrane-bound spermidine synthase